MHNNIYRQAKPADIFIIFAAVKESRRIWYLIGFG